MFAHLHRGGRGATRGGGDLVLSTGLARKETWLRQPEKPRLPPHGLAAGVGGITAAGTARGRAGDTGSSMECCHLSGEGHVPTAQGSAYWLCGPEKITSTLFLSLVLCETGVMISPTARIKGLQPPLAMVNTKKRIFIFIFIIHAITLVLNFDKSQT